VKQNLDKEEVYSSIFKVSFFIACAPGFFYLLNGQTTTLRGTIFRTGLLALGLCGMVVITVLRWVDK